MKILPWFLSVLVPALFWAISGCLPDPRLAGQEAVAAAAGPEEAHWSYSGDTGPGHWGDLNPEWVLAKNGQEQSPVDISQAQLTSSLFPLKLQYSASGIDLINNGHSIQQTWFPGSTAEVGGKIYRLLQFHFHTPSEHTINGRSYDLEMHLVHQGPGGHQFVIALLFEQGQENSFLKQLFPFLPVDRGTVIRRPDAILQVREAFPPDLSYFFYEGSLTTPPCTEGVHWYVLRQPVQASAQQIQQFRRIYDRNNRPVQPLNDRIIWATN